MAKVKPVVADDLTVQINIKWLVQIIFFIVTITAGYFHLTAQITDNHKEIIGIKEALIKYEDLVDDRVGRLETYKDQELEELNRTLMDKVLGRNKNNNGN